LQSRIFNNPANVYNSIIQALFGNQMEDFPEEAIEQMTAYLRMEHELLINRFQQNLMFIINNK
jgi:hypothetical protein